MKPIKNKTSSAKTQPKISNFLVSSAGPFSNESPQKQLKISNFFNKIDKKNSQEENINRNCLEQNIELEKRNSNSPECIPASPEFQKKRKRNNDDISKRKLLKLENYNKLLYDKDESQNLEPTSSLVLKENKANLKINYVCKKSRKELDEHMHVEKSMNEETSKISENVTKSNGKKSIQKEIQGLKKNDPNIVTGNFSQKFKDKHTKNNDTSFQSRTELIIKKVEKINHQNNQKEFGTNKNESHKFKNISQKSDSTKINKEFITNHKSSGDDVERPLPNLPKKESDTDKTEKNSSVRKPVASLKNEVSLLSNDNLLDELLGEINTNMPEDHNIGKDEIDFIKSSHNMNSDKDHTKISNAVQKNTHVSPTNLVKIDNILENVLKIGNEREVKSRNFQSEMKETSIEHIKLNKKQNVQNEKKIIPSGDLHKNNFKSFSDNFDHQIDGNSKRSKENIAQKQETQTESVSSFLKMYGIEMKSPEKKNEHENLPEKNNEILKVNSEIPLTPDKVYEISTISQDVANTLSITKSPLINQNLSQCKKQIDLSSISKIYFDDDDENWNFDEVDVSEKTVLSSFKKCEIINIEQNGFSQLKLHLKTLDTDSTSVSCLVTGSWVHTHMQQGNAINIKAEYSNEHHSWIVDNTRGLIVYESDVLVSGTAVVGALFCMRKSILSDLFKGVDAGSSIMVLGILLHQLLQDILKNKINTENEMKKLILEMISSQDAILMMYSALMSLADTQKELESFIPKIKNFLDSFVHQSSNKKNTWQGQILEIQDIEENIWLPNLGVKGKVDVTVKVESKNQIKTMPLELKTGRASKSAEHRGQVILYAMMMSEMGQTVDAGLLLYLRDNILDEIRAGHPEKRDLMMLRNQLVYYLNQDVKDVNVPFLPPPINHHSACSKCPYLYICSAALSEEGRDILDDKNPLKSISVDATSHLSEKHIRYVFHMVALLRLEFKESKQKSKQLSDVWTLNPEDRESRGDCICNLKLKSEVQCQKGRYQCTLSRSYTISSFHFNISQYVIVSTSTQPAVAAGFIVSLADTSISLSLDRDLTGLSQLDNKFHIDTYESQSLLSYNLIGLGLLLEKDHRNNASLRSIIIDKTLPQFSKKHHASILDIGADLLAKLNSGQKKAVLKSLTAQQYLLIKGMPGTGKSSTVACLIELLVRLKMSVLVTSHTHSAVDNLLVRLIDKVPFMRLGSMSRIHPKIVPYCESRCSQHCTSPEALAEFYNSKPVIGVTCMGSVHALLQKRQFDVCIVDEATQVLLPAVLPPLLAAKKFILVGDPEQLCPLVISQKASDLGLSESLFSRLDRNEVTTCLTDQYRMNTVINRLVNDFTYKGQLACANEIVEKATLPELKHESTPLWLRECLSNQLNSSVIFLNVPCGNTKGESATNQNEAQVVHTLVTTFVQAGVHGDSIGVISTYRNQVGLLRRTIRNENIEINTVDQYQGRDKDVIIYSSSTNLASKECKILNDRRRLTVAISRAKYKLIILGDIGLLKQNQKIFYELIQLIPQSNICDIAS